MATPKRSRKKEHKLIFLKIGSKYQIPEYSWIGSVRPNYTMKLVENWNRATELALHSD